METRGPLPSGNDPELLGAARALGWNWGGFLMPYFWLVGHGQVSLGLALLVTTGVPVVGGVHLLIHPLVGLYLGLNGYEAAWRHQPHHDLEQLRRRETEWRIWGFAATILFVLAAAGILAILVPAMADARRMLADYGW